MPVYVVRTCFPSLTSKPTILASSLTSSKLSSIEPSPFLPEVGEFSKCHKRGPAGECCTTLGSAKQRTNVDPDPVILQEGMDDAQELQDAAGLYVSIYSDGDRCLTRLVIGWKPSREATALQSRVQQEHHTFDPVEDTNRSPTPLLDRGSEEV